MAAANDATTPALNLPERDRRDAAIDIARYALNRILLGEGNPKLLAEEGHR